MYCHWVNPVSKLDFFMYIDPTDKKLWLIIHNSLNYNEQFLNIILYTLDNNSIFQCNHNIYFEETKYLNGGLIDNLMYLLEIKYV